MKITQLSIRNFLGIKKIDLPDLQDVVIIAGENGSGKSCILDAIKLLKSVYGGYQRDEIYTFFGERNIDIRRDVNNILGVASDKTIEVSLEMSIVFHTEELAYLKENSKDLIERSVWARLAPERGDRFSRSATSLATDLRALQPQVDREATEEMQLLVADLTRKSLTAKLVVSPNGDASVEPSKLLEVVFSNFDSESLGIIDFHGPNRVFNREVVKSINVNLDSTEDRVRNHALYGYQSKYSNIKSEMAAAYVKDIISAVAEGGKGKDDLVDTLKELFDTFFPQKKFLGPKARADGGLDFPVQIGGSTPHDLDDLSSGEKEVLYGYLRLRNSAPRHSVILLDEPELHLNPKLVRRLPDFYLKHLGEKRDNQIWLVTHSDALLRDALGKARYSVFNMVPITGMVSVDQATRMDAKSDLEDAILNLVGDLSTFRPAAPIVILEGEDSEFDVKMVSELFPEVAGRYNVVAGTNKARVCGLNSILTRLAEEGALPAKIYSIVDRDFEPNTTAALNQLMWDVYHIENYLLDSEVLVDVVKEASLGALVLTPEEVVADLREAALNLCDGLVAQRFRDEANKAMVNALSLRIDVEQGGDLATSFRDAVDGSVARLQTVQSERFGLEDVGATLSEIRADLMEALSSDDWIKVFPGRRMLQAFVAKRVNGMGYSVFRNLVVARLVSEGRVPVGMTTILSQLP